MGNALDNSFQRPTLFSLHLLKLATKLQWGWCHWTVLLTRGSGGHLVLWSMWKCYLWLSCGAWENKVETRWLSRMTLHVYPKAKGKVDWRLELWAAKKKEANDEELSRIGKKLSWTDDIEQPKCWWQLNQDGSKSPEAPTHILGKCRQCRVSLCLRCTKGTQLDVFAFHMQYNYVKYRACIWKRLHTFYKKQTIQFTFFIL